MLAYLRYRGHLRRWRMNVRTGEKREQQLDDLNVEFCLPDTRAVRREDALLVSPAHSDGPADARVRRRSSSTTTKAARAKCTSTRRAGIGNEAPFAKSTRGGAEDRGYVVTLATHGKDYASEAWIFDAQRIGKGPVARVALPGRVPIGFHAMWIPGRLLWPDKAAAA